MTSATDLLDRLRAIVGASQVLTDASDVEGYRTDGRGTAGGGPLAVVRPANAEEVAELVRLSAASGLRIVVQGARTGLAGAGLVSEETRDLIVNLDRLSRHIAIDPLNCTATVDAGARLSTLNAAATGHGLFFPIDLGADPSIGGMIAANTGGARRIRYGDVRANLMAVDLVCADAEGTHMTLGAPLWKNNTGLDLKQLLVGSSGSMGIITRATVALQPRPAAQVTALLALREPGVALDLLLALEDRFGTLLSAYEGISAAALAAALKHVRSLRPAFTAIPPYAVLIELSAGAAFDEDLLEDRLASVLASFMEGGDAPVIDVAVDRRAGL